MNNVKSIRDITQKELELGVADPGKSSWHDDYRGSAYVFVGGLAYDLTEGDVLSVMSQYGEIVNINLVRDKKTGKSKGFCFIGYEDQRSTKLTVDNLNGIKLCGRTIRIDHVKEYRRPKDEKGNEIIEKGCAPKTPTPSPSPTPSPEPEPKKKKKRKKEEKKKEKKKGKRKEPEDDNSEEDSSNKKRTSNDTESDNEHKQRTVVDPKLDDRRRERSPPRRDHREERRGYERDRDRKSSSPPGRRRRWSRERDRESSRTEWSQDTRERRDRSRSPRRR